MLFSREPTPSLQKKKKNTIYIYIYILTIRILRGCLLFFSSLVFSLLEEMSKREKEEGEKEEGRQLVDYVRKGRDRARGEWVRERKGGREGRKRGEER